MAPAPSGSTETLLVDGGIKKHRLVIVTGLSTVEELPFKSHVFVFRSAVITAAVPGSEVT